MDEENKFEEKTEEAAPWIFWISVIMILIGIVVLATFIGIFYYRLGSIKLPPECYVSNKDISVAK